MTMEDIAALLGVSLLALGVTMVITLGNLYLTATP
jgi:hypothetical protein